MGKRLRGGREGGLDGGGVAVEAVGIDGEDGGHGAGVVVGGGHRPGVAAGVEVDGELEPLAFELVDVGAAVAAGADEVGEGAFALKGLGLRCALEGHDGFAVAGEDGVVDV